MDRGAWRATVHGVAESDTTEQQNHHHYLFPSLKAPACTAALNYFLNKKSLLLRMQKHPQHSACTMHFSSTGLYVT